MMSSVSPLHPIGKLVDSGSPVSFYGLGPSNVKEISPSVNCIGVNLSTSSPSVSTNSIANIIACSTASASQNSSNVSNSNSAFKSNFDRLKANIPYAWKREQINGQIVYISPSNCLLWSLQEISAYLLTEGTCKCGLECPIILNEVFNFDPQVPSISSTLINDNKSVQYNDHTKDICYNDNPTNIEYPPKTCNHRRRTLNNCSGYSNDGYSIIKNDTHNQNSTRLADHTSENSEIANQSLHHQQHHVNSQVIHQQPLAVNSIPVYRGTHQQSIINHGVTLYKSGRNFNNSEQKQSPYTITGDCSQTAENAPKNFQHPNVNPPLTTSSFINWLPINNSDESRLSSMVNENQSNVQTFANPSSSLPGFTDVLSGMGLTQTLMDPSSQGGGQLVQLFNPVQYASVPPNTVTLLHPTQNLNRNGATIIIPQLMQSDQHSVVLNSTENVRSLERRNILPSCRANSFSSIPIQAPYSFHSQPSASYPTSSSSSSTSSPTQSFAASSSNENDNNRVKTKSRSMRHRKFKMNRNQHLSMSVSAYFCHDQETNTSIEKFTEKNSDESSRLKSDIDDEFNLEEQMDSQDCLYSTNQLTPNSDDDKSNFDYERIDGGSQCTSEDIMRELSTHKSSIRNIGIQSDELIDGPVSPTRMDESSCSDSSFAHNLPMSKDTEYDSSPSNLPEDYEENADSILETNCRFSEKNVDEHFPSDETQGGDFNNNSHNDENDKISGYQSNSSLNAYKVEKNCNETNITSYIDGKAINDCQNDSDNYQNKSSISTKKLNVDQSVSKNNVLLSMGTTEGLYERLSKTIDEESTKNKKLERLRKELLCYENNFDQTTAQSPPLSPQPRTFETGDLVWGQMRGNPSWPGKLINKEDAPSYNGQAEEGKVWVKWFGDNLVTQVELIKLKTLSEGLEAHHTARKKHRKGKKTDSCLDQAIQEAMMELDKQQSSSAVSQTTKSHPPTTSSSLPS